MNTGLTHWKKPWCWERLKAGGEGGNRGWDAWMVSLTQWTWVWASSRRWWRTGKPGVLQSTGSQSLSDWIARAICATGVTVPRSARLLTVRAGTLKQVIRLQVQSSSLYNRPRSYMKASTRCSDLELQDLFFHLLCLAKSCWWVTNGRALSITMLCFMTSSDSQHISLNRNSNPSFLFFGGWDHQERSSSVAVSCLPCGWENWPFASLKREWFRATSDYTGSVLCGGFMVWGRTASSFFWMLQLRIIGLFFKANGVWLYWEVLATSRFLITCSWSCFRFFL